MKARSSLLLVAVVSLLLFSSVTFGQSDETAPKRYEAENAYNKNDVSTVTAGAVTFVDYHGKGGFIEWLIPIERHAIYAVTVRYASGPEADRPLELHVDNKTIKFDMKKTATWTTWDTETHNVEIGAGIKTFRLFAIESVGPNVDYMEITKLNNLLGYNAHQVYDGNQWHIGRTEVSTKFEHGMSPEMTIRYEVYKNIRSEQIKVSLFTYDCSTQTEAVASVTRTFVTQEEASDPDLKILELLIDIDEANLVTSNIWDGSMNEGAFAMCVRVDILSNSLSPQLDSMSYLETILLQHVALSSSFAMEPIGFAEVIDELYVSDADIQFLVFACICEEDFSCVETPEPLKMNSALHLCVHSKSQKVQILRVIELYFVQEDFEHNGFTLFRAIEGSDPHDLTEVRRIDGEVNGNFLSLRTRLITSFFDHEAPGDVLVSGKAALVFGSANDRIRHVSLRSRSLPITSEGDDEIQAGFKMVIRLEKNEDSASSIPRVSIRITTATGLLLTLIG